MVMVYKLGEDTVYVLKSLIAHVRRGKNVPIDNMCCAGFEGQPSWGINLTGNGIMQTIPFP